jgi:hypothetical protein
MSPKRHAHGVILLAAIVVVCADRRLAAQDQAPPASQQTQGDIAALTRLVEEQRKALEQQGRLIAELTKRLDGIEQKASAEPSALQERVKELERTLRVLPELTPKEMAQADDFPGSIKIPGTEAGIRFGGQVRTNFVRNIGALGTDDRFVTSSIPIDGTVEAGRDSRTTISASPSRMETDFRTPTPMGPLRAYVSGDFAGSNRTYRLRHAFGQWRSVLIGQTWSTFSDPEAEPDGLDFEGLNAISLFRQPIIRWTKPLNERVELALAIENPSPDITGASGVNQVPDVIARLRFQKRSTSAEDDGHTQAAFLIRQVRGTPFDQTNTILSTSGVGVHVSGRLHAPWQKRDLIKFASAAGTGIGRYITDLGSEGGQDAVYDPARNSLRSLPVYSGYVGYEHWWTTTLRSTGTFGLVFVDNLDIQSEDSLRRTNRASFNLAWSPIRSVDLIAELLSGQRVDKDRQDGRASQVQFGWIFRF